MRTWILERYQTYARICLVGAIFLSPVVFYRNTVDVFNLVKITVLWVLGISALALWVAWAAERGIWLPRIRLGLATGIFLAAAVAATAISQNPALSLLGLYHRYGGLVPFALYAGIMVLIVGLFWERPGDLKDIARASGVASLLMAAYVLIQAAKLDWIQWVDASGKPAILPVGTMGNSNFAGGYLGIGVPFIVYLAATARRPFSRTLLGIVVGLAVLAVWFTHSRGGMMAAGAGLLTMAFLYRERLPRWVKAGVAVGIVLVAMVAVLVIWHPGSDRPPGPLSKIQQLSTGTLKVRAYYWGTALRIFRDNPFLGTGLETYFANYPRYRLPADGAENGLIITDKPHNIYLEYAANAGLVGVGSYLALLGLGFWYGYRHYRRLEGAPRLLLASFLAVLAGYATQGFFSIDVPPLAVMGWVALGGIAAIADPAVVAARIRLREADRRRKTNPSSKRQEQKKPSTALSGHARWPVHATLVVATAGLMFVGVRPVAADMRAKLAQTAAISEGSPEKVAAYYEEAIRLHPLEPTYRTLSGSLTESRAGAASDPAEKKRLLEQTLDRYLEAYRLQPGNIFLMMNVARVYTTWAEAIDPSRFTEADRWWKRAVTHDPTDPDVHGQYALMLNAWANASEGDPNLRRRTAEQLEEVVRIRPKDLPTWINLGKVYLAMGEVEKARAALNQALRLDPANQEARELLASL